VISVDAGTDAGVADAGVDGGCNFGAAESLAAPGMLDLFGQVAYFGDGGALPVGRYRVTYVDGCMKYSSSQDWTIHAYSSGSIAWWLVGRTTNDKFGLPPGTSGYSTATGAFAVFDDCVAANLLLPPMEFEHDGGPIGIWLQDSPYSDNVAGLNGRNPAWSLTGLNVTCQ
jgi:hypothetical protein